MNKNIKMDNSEEKRRRSLVQYREIFLENIHQDDRFENAIFIIIMGFSIIAFIIYIW